MRGSIDPINALLCLPTTDSTGKRITAGKHGRERPGCLEETYAGGNMDRSFVSFGVLLVAAALFSGCRGNVTGTDTGGSGKVEYSEDFSYSVSSAGVAAFSLSNINGTITVTGEDTATRISVSGLRVLSADSRTTALNHISDIRIDTLTSQDEFAVTTIQPNSQANVNYRVDYEVVLPRDMKVRVTDVNGTVVIGHINGPVNLTITNGVFTARGISGNLAAGLVNGNIDAEVELPDSGLCDLQTVNGNIKLAVPNTTSASVDASVMNGTVSFSNLPVTVSSSSRTHLTGVMGTGIGQITISTLNGIIQMTSM